MIILTNIFIVVYLAYAWSWHLPKDSHANRFVHLASPVILWFGLWHSWKMFAPRPDSENRRLIIELVHANRCKVIIQEMNVAELSRWHAFLNCRERKYQNNLAGINFKSHWESLCRYAAKNYSTLDSPVVRVNLIVARQRIPAPGRYDLKPFVETRLLKWKVDETQSMLVREKVEAFLLKGDRCGCAHPIANLLEYSLQAPSTLDALKAAKAWTPAFRALSRCIPRRKFFENPNW